MTIIDKINKLINSIDTKGQVIIKIIEDDSLGYTTIRLCLLDNTLCCDVAINPDKFDENYQFAKDLLNKKIRLLTEECYRNSDCL